MKFCRAYKTELDPTNKQRTLFLRCAGAARFVFNWALADRKSVFEAGGKPNRFEQKRRFNALKHNTYPWLDDVPYALIEQAFLNLDCAYQRFFRRVRQGKEKPGFPHFKSRRQGIGSFTLRGAIHIEQSRVKLPRIGWVRLKERDYLPMTGARILSVNISERACRWYISVQVEIEKPAPIPSVGSVIGVDLGIKVLATCSNGVTFVNPRALDGLERRLKHVQRTLSRRKKGSKNREKARRAFARLHQRIGNIRANTLHNVSHYLTAKTKPGVVVIEDLNVKGMLANHHLAKAVSDASFGELRRQLEYKAAWYGVDLVIAGRFYPSSKTCSGCGSVKPYLALSTRTFVCQDCGIIIDRDLNAAVNLASLAVKPTVSVCGEGKDLAPCEQPSVKQEPGSERGVGPGGNL